MQWLSIPEVAELLDVRQREVRAMISEHYLAGMRRGPNSAVMIPSVFFDNDAGYLEPMRVLRGTLIALNDGGLSTDESVQWLLNIDDELGIAPIDALRAGNIHAVRIRAAMLAI